MILSSIIKDKKTPNFSHLYFQKTICSDNGVCECGRCQCNAGFRGDTCERCQVSNHYVISGFTNWVSLLHSFFCGIIWLRKLPIIKKIFILTNSFLLFLKCYMNNFAGFLKSNLGLITNWIVFFVFRIALGHARTTITV